MFIVRELCSPNNTVNNIIDNISKKERGTILTYPSGQNSPYPKTISSTSKNKYVQTNTENTTENTTNTNNSISKKERGMILTDQTINLSNNKILKNLTTCSEKIEQPQDYKNQESENLPLENLPIDNVTQLNTKKKITKKQNTNNSIKKERKTSNTSSGTTKENEYVKNNRPSFNEIIESYTDDYDLKEELKEHLRVRKAKGSALTNGSIIRTLSNLDKLANNTEDKIKIVREANAAGRTSFYQLSKYQTKKAHNNDYCEPSDPSYDIDEYESYSIFNGK